MSVNNINDDLFSSLTPDLLKLKLRIQSRTRFFASSPVLSTESIPILWLFQSTNLSQLHLSIVKYLKASAGY